MKIVAFLPAKGSSERIQCKNTKLINGKPLFLHTLEKLCECDFIDEVYLDSEDDYILNYASYLNYIPLKRDIKYATNKTDGHKLFYNEIKQVDADIYIQILGTSPFIKPETIRKGIDILKDDRYDSVVLVKKEKEYLWEDGRPLYDKNNIPNSADLPETTIESMGLYIVKHDIAHKNKMRYGENIYLLEADAVETIDVNYPDEFALAELIMRGQKERENHYHKVLASFLNSALLSDILCEMGYQTTITGLTVNLKDKKILGRANTLKIRKLDEGEDYRGIYKGLKSYETICPGEIIVVRNDVPERAYFGELNANLAIRAGAIGTIISGVTRDSTEVKLLDYMVFSEGYCSSDIKGFGTIDYIEKPIEIQGVRIVPGDLIFGDVDGIVCIPKHVEKKVLKLAIKNKQKESSILNRILNNEDAIDIYNDEGEF